MNQAIRTALESAGECSYRVRIQISREEIANSCSSAQDYINECIYSAKQQLAQYIIDKHVEIQKVTDEQTGTETHDIGLWVFTSEELTALLDSVYEAGLGHFGRPVIMSEETAM